MCDNIITDDNIVLSFDKITEDDNDTHNNTNIIEWLLENRADEEIERDVMMSHNVNYNVNYTLKELMFICEYYGISKEMKMNKYNKSQIVDFLVTFEANPLHVDIVCRRHLMWFYINELKNDKIMKKFVLW